MKKNIKFMLFSILAIFFISTPHVLAADKVLDRTLIKIDGQFVHKIYDNIETGETDIVSDPSSVTGKIFLLINDEQKIGFCIEFGVDFTINGEADIYKIKDYFAKGIGEEAAEELSKKLIEYTRFGYGSEGKKTEKYYLATQQLIWEAISDTGFYASDYYYNLSGGKVDKLRIKNYRWAIDNGKTVIDLKEEINAIKTSINNYYKSPSFCSSQEKIEIEVGETAEYTDNNGVLSKFEIKCDSGIECQVDGNKLKVTAINEAGTNRITFTKKDTNKTENYIYKHGNGQAVIAESGILEPVSCEFGIDSFKNEKTADIKIIYVITIGLFGGIMAYIIYYTKKSLDGLN